MVRRLQSETTSPSAGRTTSHVPTASMSSTPSLPVFTPSSLSFGFGAQRSTSPSFTFRAPIASDQASFTFDDDDDPDRPLPSVEGEASSISSRQSTPSTTLYTPSNSTHAAPTRQASDHDAFSQQIVDLRNLTLTLSQTPATSPQRGARTPSIHITPSTSPNESSQPRASRTDSLVGGIAALNMDSLQAGSSNGAARQGSASPSPSPSRRSRSRSGVSRDRYQVENEEPPQALFHTSEVQEALASARGLTARLTTILSSSNLHRENGSSIQNLHQQAIRLNRFQLPSSRIVGLVGDSGVGKSSLINSLLDKVNLARASSSGTACTCAVTEYLFHDRDSFTIHVDYFPMDELKRQFEELLGAYREYQSLPRSSRLGSGVDESEGDRRLLQKKADLARETFKASFGSRIQQTPGILTSMPIENAVGMMVEWASQQLPPQGERESFSTVEECSSRLRELTSQSDDSSQTEIPRTSWPFIKKLRVYLKAFILSKGLIIADLPGLRDLNSARKAITERYIRECHQIFVVARIERAATDESIKDIFGLASRANLAKIDVICTRSEDIHAREAVHDWPAERATIEEMQLVIDSKTEEINSLKEEMEDYGSDLTDLTREDEREIVRLQHDCRRAEKCKRDTEFELRRHIVNTRNNKVSQLLRTNYRLHPIARLMKVFCISNKMYWDKHDQPVTASSPYINLSGIPLLRRHCIGIVAESHLRAVKGFIRDELPAFLGSIELWIEAGSGSVRAERKQQVLDAVLAIERELDELTSPVSQLNIVSHTLNEGFNNQIQLRMSKMNFDATGSNSHQVQDEADRNGLPMPDERVQAGRWHHSSYKAFCSNYGDHSTRAIGYRCWNEEAMVAMKDDMSAIWDSFLVDLESDIEQITVAAVQVFDSVLGIVRSFEIGEADNTRSTMRILGATLRHRKDFVRNELEEANESFHSELASFYTDAFSSIRTAFIGLLIEDTYHAANIDDGSGVDRRRKNSITGRFGSPDLFDVHRRKCRDRFRAIAQGLQDNVKEIVKQQVELIEADLQMLRDENVVLESERNPEFREQVGTEANGIKDELNRIGRVFEGST